MSQCTRDMIVGFLKDYPVIAVEDVYKFLHQSSMGCGHLISDEVKACSFIQAEYEGCVSTWPDLQELDGPYVRVGLGYLDRGLSAATLARLMSLSCEVPSDGESALVEKLGVFEALARDGAVPFDASEVCGFIKRMKEQGLPAIHHSDAFRDACHPAYRVVSSRFAYLLDVFAAIDRALANSDGGPLKVALEGSSASGKTTAASVLAGVYGCTVFHMDDFFLRPEQRTPERFAQPGGNVDRERFMEQVVVPLERGEAVDYIRFDCSTFTLKPPVRIVPTRLVIVEGAYCMHPELRSHWDLSVFMDVDPSLQRQRILKRNSPESAQRFFDRWIPFEHRYFEAFDVKASCSMVVPVV